VRHRQVQPLMGAAYRYDGAWQAVQALLSQRSVAAGLMRGYRATNAVWLPWNAIYIACYEESKRVAAASLDRHSGSLPSPAGLGRPSVAALPGWAVAGCAAGSATVAVTLTHPADVVKTRLQVSSSIQGGQWLCESSNWHDADSLCVRLPGAISYTARQRNYSHAVGPRAI